MDTLYQRDDEKKGISKVLLVAILLALLSVAGIIGLWSMIPPTEVVKHQVLEGAFREGSPEFQALTSRIVIFNDAQNTMESPTGLGTITMFVRGGVRNNSDKTLTALEIKVGVLDPFDKVIKEKLMTVVPTAQNESLMPQEMIQVTIPIEGFAKEDDRARVQWKVTAIKVRQ